MLMQGYKLNQDLSGLIEFNGFQIHICCSVFAASGGAKLLLETRGLFVKNINIFLKMCSCLKKSSTSRVIFSSL